MTKFVNNRPDPISIPSLGKYRVEPGEGFEVPDDRTDEFRAAGYEEGDGTAAAADAYVPRDPGEEPKQTAGKPAAKPKGDE